MTMIAPIERTDDRLARTQVAGLVALAGRMVAPLWPLESAIAVNPLAGFEELPFAQAVEEASKLFGAHRTLPLALWRRLLDNGRIDEAALRDAAIGHLGGIYRAAAPIAPGVTMLDALMARLLVIGRGDRPERRAGTRLRCCIYRKMVRRLFRPWHDGDAITEPRPRTLSRRAGYGSL